MRRAPALVVFLFCLALGPGEAFGQGPPPWPHYPDGTIPAEVVEVIARIDLGDKTGGATALAALLARARAEAGRASEAHAHRGLGYLAYREARYADAQAEFDAALALFREAGDSHGVGLALNHLGSLAWVRGDRPLARRQYDAALVAFEAAVDPRGQALVLGNLALVGRDMAETEAFVERGLSLSRGLGDDNLLAQFLHVRGDVLRNRGEFSAALAALQESAALYERLRRDDKLAGVLTSQASLYRQHGRLELALETHRRALAIQERRGDRAASARAQRTLGMLLIRLQRLPEARAALVASVEIARTIGAMQTLGSSLLELCWVDLAEGKFGSAEARLAESQPILDSHPITTAEFHTVRGELWSRTGRLADGVAEFEAAARLFREQGAKSALLGALDRISRVREGTDDHEAALAASMEAIAILESLRPEQVNADSFRVALVEPWRPIYERAVRLLVRAGRGSEAFEVAERGRARALLELLAIRDGGTTGVRPAKAASLAEARETAARLGSTLLTYFVTDRETFAWSIAPSGTLETRRLPATAAVLGRLAASLDAASGAFGAGRGLPTRGGGALLFDDRRRAAERELFDLLVRPLTGALPTTQASRLTIVPHGPLLSLPFAALRGDDDRYLVERYALHEAPAVGALRFAARETGALTRRPVFVGAPSFERQASGQLLPLLPGTRSEVEAGARALTRPGEEHPRVLLGSKASEEQVRTAIGGASLLHIATHGVLDETQPLDSYLALGRSGGTPASDGRLTAGEVYGLRTDARLVVLSACRSSRGPATPEGVTGLTRGFLAAGAASVVSTLWDVADEPTRRVMAAFYRNLAKGLPVDASLRQAQLRLLGDLRAGRVAVSLGGTKFTLPEHPALWAGFVLWGEP